MKRDPAGPVSAFDSVAGSYDATFDQNLVGARIRQLVGDGMLRYFRAGDHVLDINCGTGTDATYLANRGIFVTAIDSSPRMIEMANKKVKDYGVENLVQTRVSSYADLEQCGGPFDGVISNFGGLNCTRQLESVLDSIHRTLKPGGVFLATVMNRYCMWECGSYFIRGKFREGMRRFEKHAVMALVGGVRIPIRYYAPTEFSRLCQRRFDILGRYGINIFSPSPNSQRFILHHPGLTRTLLRIDDYLRTYLPFRSLGDHFVVEARRRAT